MGRQDDVRAGEIDHCSIVRLSSRAPKSINWPFRARPIPRALRSISTVEVIPCSSARSTGVWSALSRALGWPPWLRRTATASSQPAGGGEVQWRLAGAGAAVGFGAGGDQRLGDGARRGSGHVATASSRRAWRRWRWRRASAAARRPARSSTACSGVPPKLVGGVHIGTRVQEQAHHVPPCFSTAVCSGRLPVVAAGVDASRRVEQDAARSVAAPRDGGVQRRVAGVVRG